MNNTHSLVEGMEARVSLPTNNRRRTLIVPRDAVLNLSGKNVVFAIVDSKARTMPVRVIGYQGNQAGVEGEGLAEGMKVAIKGNERLREGQAVTILNQNR
jgi:multidrug efflux pump subunit AcrA (membrane-fusion protein)